MSATAQHVYMVVESHELAASAAVHVNLLHPTTGEPEFVEETDRGLLYRWAVAAGECRDAVPDWRAACNTARDLLAAEIANRAALEAALDRVKALAEKWAQDAQEHRAAARREGDIERGWIADDIETHLTALRAALGVAA
jgi:hypothetical protein